MERRKYTYMLVESLDWSFGYWVMQQLVERSCQDFHRLDME